MLRSGTVRCRGAQVVCALKSAASDAKKLVSRLYSRPGTRDLLYGDCVAELSPSIKIKFFLNSGHSDHSFMGKIVSRERYAGQIFGYLPNICGYI